MLVSDHGDGRLSLTSAQSGVWFAQQLDPHNAIFNTGEFMEIGGPVDGGLFEAALRQVVTEAETLRVRFTEADGVPAQQVVPAAEFAWSMRHCDVSGEPDPWAAAKAWMDEDLATPLDPLRDQLFAFALFKLAEDRFLWLYRYHHLLVDGFSVVAVARRTTQVYGALVAGEPVPPSPFGPLTLLLEEKTAYPESATHDADRAYWLERLDGCPEPVSLSGRQPGLARALVRETSHFAPESNRLRELASEAGVSWPPVLIAAIAAYLGRLSGVGEVVLGLPVSTRLGRTARSVPGMVANVLPLRVAIDDEMSVSELLRQVSAEMRAAMRHQRYQFEDLRRDLGMLADERRLVGPHVNIMMFDYDLAIGGHPTRAHTLSVGPADDLSFVVYDRGAEVGLQIDFDANPELYGSAELREYQRGFLDFLDRLGRAGADTPIGRVEIDVTVDAVAVAEVPAQAPAAAVPVPRRGRLSPQEEILCGLFAEVLGLPRFRGRRQLLRPRRSLAARDPAGQPDPHGLRGRGLPADGVRGAHRRGARASASSGAGGPARRCSPMDRPDELPLSPAQRRLWFLNRMEGPSRPTTTASPCG
jgi:hypothetical protein